MSIVYIFLCLIALLFYPLLALCGYILIVGCVAAFKGNRAKALQSVIVCCPVAVLTFGAYSVSSMFDPGYVRKPVPASELVGTYHLDPGGGRKYLARLGYNDFSGKITLKPSGRFTATRFPVCFIEMDEETKVGYYEISGIWTVEKDESHNVYQVKFTDETMMSGRRTLTVDLSKRGDAPIALTFPMYNGSDFNHFYYFRTRE